MLLHFRKDFPDILKAVGAKRGVPIQLVERDYWMVEAVRAIQSTEGLEKCCPIGSDASLTIGLRLIKRFSDVIDLVITPSAFRSAGDLWKINYKIIHAHPGFSKSEGLSKKGELRFCYPSIDPQQPRQEIIVRQHCPDRCPLLPQKYLMRSMVAEEVKTKSYQRLHPPVRNLKAFTVIIVDPVETLVEKLIVLGLAQRDGLLPQNERHLCDVHCLLGLSRVQKFLLGKKYSEIKKSVIERNAAADGHMLNTSCEIFTSSVRRAYRQSQLYYGERPTIEEIEASFKQWSGRF